jgi:hypothetical protein
VTPHALVVTLVAAVVAAGCGGDESDESDPAAAGPQIALRDFSIDPESVTVDAAGTTTFRVVNEGDTTHALEIEGNGIEERPTTSSQESRPS